MLHESVHVGAEAQIVESVIAAGAGGRRARSRAGAMVGAGA